MTLSVEVQATHGPARATTITTARGTVTTPCFMPVGTRGVVRAVETEDLEALGAQSVLGNTYHLLFRPGPEVVEGLGGIHGLRRTEERRGGEEGGRTGKAGWSPGH